MGACVWLGDSADRIVCDFKWSVFIVESDSSVETKQCHCSEESGRRSLNHFFNGLLLKGSGRRWWDDESPFLFIWSRAQPMYLVNLENLQMHSKHTLNKKAIWSLCYFFIILHICSLVFDTFVLKKKVRSVKNQGENWNHGTQLSYLFCNGYFFNTC